MPDTPPIITADSPKKNPYRWLLILTLIVSVTVGALLIQRIRVLSFLLSQTQTARHSATDLFKKNHQKLQEQLQQIQEEKAKMEDSYRSVALDRDNLLAQFKRILEEKNAAHDNRRLLEEVIKRTADRHRELRSEYQAALDQYEQLHQEYASALADRDLLQQKLEDASHQPQAAELREALDEERLRRKKDLSALNDAEQRLQQVENHLAKTKSRFQQLEKRFTALQEEYKGLLSENSALKLEVKKRPKGVMKLAKQHERLLEETADVHYNLGVFFSENKDFRRAETEFRKVLELRAFDAEAHYNLGVIYAEHLPNRSKALEHFAQYLKIHPNASDASWVKQYIASWKAWEGQERIGE